MSQPADPPAYGREAADPDCLSDAQADALLAGAPWRRFAVLGDSIAEGLGDPVPGYRPLPWGARTARALERQQPQDFRCLNLGRRDLLTAQVRATQLAPALAFRPDLALLIAGGNDLLRPVFGHGAQVQADLDAMVVALRDAGAEVLTCTMFDITRSGLVPAAYRERLGRRLAELADRIRAVAADRGTLHVDFASHPAAADAGIYSADVRHCNHRGHAIAAAGAVRRLGRRLGHELPA